MKRVEFKLTMPGVASWNNSWSGSGKNYIIVRSITDEKAKNLLDVGYWSHHWNDGWCAGISIREMQKGERRKKSDGFCGYDWMVRNIISHGTPYNDK